MLAGGLPYGRPLSERRVRSGRLAYRSVRELNDEVPAWADAAIRKTVHPDPSRRYDTLSEFLYDLNHPNPELERKAFQPLMERNPLRFWQAASALLLVLNLLLLFLLAR